MTASLVALGGRSRAGDRWVQPADPVDRRVLARAGRGPVLDVGCGPGRHTVALAERGIPALGIDITGAAIARLRRSGAAALERCVFDRVPGGGRYSALLLLDGNVGIGAEPAALLRRCAVLVRADGTLLVETVDRAAASGAGWFSLRVDGRHGPSFAWIDVTTDALPALACSAGLVIDDAWTDRGRDFAQLRRSLVAGTRR